MSNNSFFVAIEGLDGSGKTEMARHLTKLLQKSSNLSVYLAYEPYELCAAGMFIRQALSKQVKPISQWTLALAFAANRLDHCDRVINPFLDDKRRKQRVLVCDRYYLSSIVYQTEIGAPFSKVMELNRFARKPDLTIFLDADSKTCFERMHKRGQDKELFEKNLTITREQYHRAIEYLRNENDELIVKIDASDSKNEVLHTISSTLATNSPEWLTVQPILGFEYQAEFFSTEISGGPTLRTIAEQYEDEWQNHPILTQQDLVALIENLRNEISSVLSSMRLNDLGCLFIDLARLVGYRVGDQRPWADVDAFAAEYTMPLGIPQYGILLLLSDRQRHDMISTKALKDRPILDFMIVFSPEEAGTSNGTYDRDSVNYGTSSHDLSPQIKVINISHLANGILYLAIDNLISTYLHTIRAFPSWQDTLLECRNQLDIGLPHH